MTCPRVDLHDGDITNITDVAPVVTMVRQRLLTLHTVVCISAM